MAYSSATATSDVAGGSITNNASSWPMYIVIGVVAIVALILYLRRK